MGRAATGCSGGFPQEDKRISAMLRNWWRRQPVNPSARRADSSRRLSSQLRFRPQVEGLEERCAPAIALTVGPNVNTGPILGNQFSPTIAINPTNPMNIFVAASDENSQTNTPPGGLMVSTSMDGGMTWSSGIAFVGGSAAPALGDPKAVFDSFGNLFMVYVTTGGNVRVVRSIDGGQTFLGVTTFGAAGLFSPANPTIGVGPGSLFVAYDNAGPLVVQGSRDTGFGSVPAFKAFNVPGTLNVNFPTIAVGPSGQVVVAYAEWLTPAQQGTGPTIINCNTDPLGFNGTFGPQQFVTNTNVGGSHIAPPQPFINSAHTFISSHPNIAFDNGPDANRGSLVIVYTDDTNQFAAPDYIYARTSIDNGATWGNRVQVNDVANGNSDFFPTIANDPITGAFAVSWYDARNAGPKDNTTQLFGAVSVDGGKTFAQNVQIEAGMTNGLNSEPAPPGIAPSGYGTHLFSLAFYNSVYFPVWCDNSNSTGDNPDGSDIKFDIYTARCFLDVLPTVNPVSLTPNPGVANHPINLIGLITSIYPQNGFTVQINWGDGTPLQQFVTPPGGTFNLNIQHTYGANGTYTVTLTVIDTNGGKTIVTFTEVIGNIIALTATGSDAGVPADVKVFDDASGNPVADIQPFGPFLGGVRVAMGDVNGDGTPDVICAAGPGGLPQVSVYDGKTLQVIRTFFAFGGGFRGGLFVAAGDVNGDGFGDIIVGADAGGGPQVEVFDGRTGAVLYNFFAFNPFFRGGVRVAAGDVNGDGKADIICGAGPGTLPQVTVFDGSTGQPLNSVLGSFFAFGQIPNAGSSTPSAAGPGSIPFFTGGIYVAAGDINGDGRADIIIGAGPGGGPQIITYSGSNGQILNTFFAFPATFKGGVRVGATHGNLGAFSEIVAAPGPGGGPMEGIYDPSTVSILAAWFVYPPTAYTGGLYVAGA
jgi:hypothetical protein